MNDKFTALYEKVIKPEVGIGNSRIEDPVDNPAVKELQKEIAQISKELDDRINEFPAESKFLDDIDGMKPAKGKLKKAPAMKPVKIDKGKLEKPTPKKTVSLPKKRKTKLFREKIYSKAFTKVEKLKESLRKKCNISFPVMLTEANIEDLPWYFVGFARGGRVNWLKQKEYEAIRKEARLIPNIVDLIIPSYSEVVSWRGKQKLQERGLYPGYYVLVTKEEMMEITGEKYTDEGQQKVRYYDKSYRGAANQAVYEFTQQKGLVFLNPHDPSGKTPFEMDVRTRQIVTPYIMASEGELTRIDFEEGEEVIYTDENGDSYSGKIESIDLDEATAQVGLFIFRKDKYDSVVTAKLNQLRRIDDENDDDDEEDIEPEEVQIPKF